MSTEDARAQVLGATITASDSTEKAGPRITHADARNEAYLSKLNKWWSDDEEATVRRKLDKRIVITSFLLYGCALLDRSNTGNAKTAGMLKDLHMSDSQFQWLLTIFYIAYIVFQFQVFMYQLFPPRAWMAFCVFGWGVAGVCQAAAKNWQGMMAARFFLGVSEAGYGTGWALYLSFFYPKTEIGLRFGVFVSAGAIAAAVAGSMAYGLVHAHTSLAPWRLLFLIEGIPTLIMVPIVYFVLPNSIQSASFLDAREKAIAEARLFRRPPPEAIAMAAAAVDDDVQPGCTAGLKEKVRWSEAFDAFKDPMSYIAASLLFIINVGYSSVPVYTPTLIAEMGYGSIDAQGLSAPPYVLAFMLSLFACWLTDRWQIRGPVCVFFLVIGGVGYLMLALLRSTVARYVGVWLIINGLFPFIPILYMWLIANQASESKRGLGLVIFGTVGQCGPLLGTRLFPANEKPYYVKGTSVSAGIILLGALIAVAASFRFWRINRLRSQQDDVVNIGSDIEHEKGVTMSEADTRKIDVIMRGEDSPYFRYTI